jgi:hypothetical protein
VFLLREHVHHGVDIVARSGVVLAGRFLGPLQVGELAADRPQLSCRPLVQVLRRDTDLNRRFLLMEVGPAAGKLLHDAGELGCPLGRGHGKDFPVSLVQLGELASDGCYRTLCLGRPHRAGQFWVARGGRGECPPMAPEAIWMGGLGQRMLPVVGGGLGQDMHPGNGAARDEHKKKGRSRQSADTPTAWGLEAVRSGTETAGRVGAIAGRETVWRNCFRPAPARCY